MRVSPVQVRLCPFSVSLLAVSPSPLPRKPIQSRDLQSAGRSALPAREARVPRALQPVSPTLCGRVGNISRSKSLAGQRHQDDSELLRRCLAGDEVAWRDLIERYRQLVYTVPARHGLMPDECDDVFQSVFLALLKNVSTLRDHQALAKWLIVTAMRESARVRSARTQDDLARAARTNPGRVTENPPDAELDRLERHHRIWVAMERLEPRCRDLLIALFGGDGRPDYSAISRQLGMPVGSIGPSRARCLARLVGLVRER
jgi:RNA polymerase sigma factor (sigma-70 family)